MAFPSCFGFIPARYASTRFPGKPLADVMGKPMFWHVWSRASRCGRLAGVHLCTDDTRIMDAAASLGVPCLMTRKDHANGSSRVFEAATALRLPDDVVVVNIQGDEPALEPAMLDALVAPFSDAGVSAATLACPVGRGEALLPDRVKVVCDAKGNALYFSRSAIPFERDAAKGGESPYRLHVGIYAYRMRALAAYAALPSTPLEEMESLEQLRFLENGIPMRVAVTNHRSHGVDSPEDLERILPLMAEK
jgi:3-deoxy-manno-octulosonate cytidylyltransferase (CMP-KDO synthetase)